MHRRQLIAASAGFMARTLLPAGIAAMVGRGAAADIPGTHAFAGAVMGTTYGVRLHAVPDDESLARLAEAVHAALTAVDRRMSTYDRASELSRLNASRETGWQTLSADTTTVVARAQHTSRATGGAFDVTVGPLVDLWGFGPSRAPRHTPPAREVAALLARVGWRHVQVDTAAHAVRKTRPDACLDLSGIAKGFGVDAAAAVLRAHGIGDYLIEVGGELAARGARPDGSPWRVGIERPEPGPRRVSQVVDLKGRAIATSGDYRNFFEQDGRRYSHSIDPRDGTPVRHTLAAVSVIAERATDADALSTALMVMGPDEGPEWARRQAIAALFVRHDGSTLREQASSAFEPFLLG